VLGRNDAVDDDGVYRSIPKVVQNVISESGGGGRGRSSKRGSSLDGGDEDVGWRIDTKKY
jgi:hypothetical protein